MKIDIKKPCDADWNKMKIGFTSRHCDLCNKNVIDFRTKTNEEILRYLLQNRNQKTCGRFYKSQLDYVHIEKLITVSALRKMPQNKAFALLTIACFVLASCTSSPQIKPQSQVETTELSLTDSAQTTRAKIELTEKIDTIKQKKCVQKDTTKNELIEIMTGEVEIMGDVMELPIVEPIEITHDTEVAKQEILNYAEIMPEFPGGTDSLFAYIKKNLRYPEYEMQNDIQGRIYARFVIDTTGQLSNPEILRSIAGAQNLDAAVLKLLDEMPKWKPGMQSGKKVAVYFTLPFAFKL